MRSMKSFFGFRKIQKKYLCMLAVLSLLSVVTVSTYAYFVLSTDGLKASELLVAELAYGIVIEEDGTSISTINNNVVSVPAGEKAYFYVTISSVNKIDSKYTLAYKNTNDAVVKYTDKTPWSSQGVIKGYDENTYAKRIRVVIDNTNESNDANVTFSVYGGYTFNTYTAISLGDGFFSVGGPYAETLASKAVRLVDVVEENTDCVTDTGKSCFYSGGAINNYLQYPEDEDKSKNLWRVMGTYKDGEKTIAKIVSESTGTTSVANMNTSLSSFYNSLENTIQVIHKTSNFDCSAGGCSTSNFNNIGLISTYEYETLGGINSYLGRANSYFALNGSSIRNITSDGIVETNDDTTSGLRPSVYLQTDVKVTGSGTVSDPYVISQRSDINLVAYTLKGEETTETYSWLLKNKVVDSVKCEKGTKAVWNYSNNTITLSNVVVPDYCTIDFTDGYVVTLSAPNGNITTANPMGVGHGQNATFTVTPKTDYTLTGATVSCTNSQSAEINQSTGLVTVKGVTSATTCTVTLQPDKMTLYAQILDDHKTRLTRTDFNSVFTNSNTGTLYTVNGNYTEGAKTVYYFAGNAQDNWVKFGKDTNGADLYWRIIRTNEDGSVRLLYVGTAMNTTAGYINASQAYNGTYNNPMYVGYMYGTSGSLASNRNNTTNSPIKTTIDTWYNGSLNAKTDAAGNKYDKYVSRTAIYCNDRANEGYTTGSTAFYYAGYKRLVDAKRPSYKCGNNSSGSLYSGTNGADNADRFSSSTSTTYTNGVNAGNGKLQYPVAMMTADEIVFAGGKYGTNSQAWYYYNSSNGSVVGDKWWWTMSPYYWSGSYALVFFVYGSSNPGYLNGSGVHNAYAVRPVVSLKSCTLASSGNGTISSPYTVEINSTCAGRDN